LAAKSTSGRIAVIDVAAQSMRREFGNKADGEGSNVIEVLDTTRFLNAIEST
jgi:hypothetical protein